MASMKNYGLAGVGSDVQYGKDGGSIDWDATNKFSATSDGVTLTQLRVATTPLAGNDAGSKTYIDTQIQQYVQGLDVKNSVRVRGQVNIANLAAHGTVDGLTLVNTDRVLLTAQTDQTENGIYVSDGTGLTRSADADNLPGNEVSGGMFTFVEEGTDADSGWSLVTPNGIASLGVDNLVFSQFSGAGDYIGGNGIDITGTTVSVDADGTTITNTGGTGAQAAVYGGTANQSLISAGAADAAWGWQTTLYDSTGDATLVTADPAGATVNWLTVTGGDATTSVVQLGIGGAGAGNTNADLELSARGTGLVIAPSGYDMSAGPGSAFTDKTYVDASIASAIDTGNFQIASDDTFTFVRTETTNGGDQGFIEMGVETTAGGASATSILFLGKPAGSTDNAGTTVFQSGNNGIQIFSTGDDAPNGVNDEVRIEGYGTAADVDIRLVPKGAGQVFIGDTGQGIIQADDNFALSAIGGDSDGTGDAGALNLLGGDGATSFASGDVNIAGGAGGSTVGGVNIRYQETANTFTDIMLFDGVASAVNYFQTTNAATGFGPDIAAAGTDANIDINLSPKGTGDVVVPSGYVPGGAYSLVTKTYADTLVGAADLDFQADTGGALNIDLDSEVMTYAGTTNQINTAGVLNTVTWSLSSTLTTPGSITSTSTITAGTGLTVTTGGATINGNTDVNGTLDANDTFNLVDNANSGQIAITAVAGTVPDVDLLLDAAGTGFVILPSGTSFAGAPDNAVSTKGYVDASIASSTDELTFRTAIVTSATKTIGTMAAVAGKEYMVTRVVIDVTTAFDAEVANAITGSGSTAIVTNAQIDLGTIGTYVVDDYNETLDNTGAAITWVAQTGATTGNAVVTVEYKAFTPTI